MDDTWLDEETFVQNMSAILEEKLYSHDQKKIVQKVELGKESPESLNIVRNDLDHFYQNFANSLKNIFGFVSYKNLQEYLDKL